MSITIEKIQDWSLGLCLQWYLMASYLYYIEDESLLEDHVYDEISKRIRSQWDLFEHPYKILVSKEDLIAGTLYGLSERDYPKRVRSAAKLALQIHKGEL